MTHGNTSGKLLNTRFIAETKTVSLKSVLAGVITAVMMISSGCADDPSPVGSSLLPPGDVVAVDSLVIVAGKSSGEKAIPYPFTANRTTIALGDSGGFEAWTFLHFSGFPDSLGNATFLSADVRLQQVYQIGDSLANLSFLVHKAIGDWNRSTFVFDSLATPGIYELNGSGKTLSPTGEFSVDTAFVREWARSVTDTAFKNFGIVLEPQAGSAIKGFQSGAVDSVELRPTLTIRYLMSGSAQEDTLILNTVIDKFVAGMADTTLLRDSVLVPISGGAAYRGVVGIDVSSIPAHAAIHRAYLDLTFDAASSHVASNQQRSLLALYAGVLNTVQTSETLTSNPSVYRFNVTEFVQAMVRGGGTDIRFAVEDEANTVGIFLMHGAAAPNTALRPKITVLYSPTR